VNPFFLRESMTAPEMVVLPTPLVMPAITTLGIFMDQGSRVF